MGIWRVVVVFGVAAWLLSGVAIWLRWLPGPTALFMGATGAMLAGLALPRARAARRLATNPGTTASPS